MSNEKKSYSHPDYRRMDDKQLLVQLGQKDRHAFDEVFHRYWDVLYLHSFRMLGDDDLSKDTVQEVFIKLWQLDAHDIHDNLSGYLYRMVRRRVLNTIRSHRTGEAFIDKLAHFATEVDNSTLHELDAKALAVQLDREINRLPEKMREVFILSRKEYLSHREIAEKLGISEQTVKNQITNAIKVLRVRMGNIGVIALLLADYLHD